MVSRALMTADVVVAGGGVVGLCAAVALAERGVGVLIVSQSSVGEASRAAAGMLAPSVERPTAEVDEFGIASRDRFPSYLESLAERTGIEVSLNRRGILQIALSEKGIKGLRRSASPGSSWLDRNALVSLEPALSHALGAVHNPLDGSVDNVVLADALASAATASDRITILRERITAIATEADGALATTAGGTRVSAKRIVIAAGAWSGTIEGAPLGRAVVPIKGQLVEFERSTLSHVVYGPRGYLVPRGGSAIAGSTTERTGFESSTTHEGIAKVSSAATEICPGFDKQPARRAWAGLRPVTPDGRPLIGSDPEMPSVIYACGHGRNGILMAPLTGDLVADLVTGSPLRHDLVQFRPDRF
jgi:glycine oxidase